MHSDLIPDFGKCPNQKTHEIRKYVYLRVFWLCKMLQFMRKSVPRLLKIEGGLSQFGQCPYLDR